MICFLKFLNSEFKYCPPNLNYRIRAEYVWSVRIRSLFLDNSKLQIKPHLIHSFQSVRYRQNKEIAHLLLQCMTVILWPLFDAKNIIIPEHYPNSWLSKKCFKSIFDAPIKPKHTTDMNIPFSIFNQFLAVLQITKVLERWKLKNEDVQCRT